MNTKLAVSLGTALLGTCVALGAARANTFLLQPISGAAFDERSGCIHSQGAIQSPLSASAETFNTTASLGRSAGGANGFTVYGANSGFTLKCQVIMHDGQDDGFGFQALGQTTATGPFSFHIQTNVNGPNVYYTISCDLPGGSSIIGVTPDV